MTKYCNHPKEGQTVDFVLGSRKEIYWQKYDGLYRSPTDEREVYVVHRMLRPIYKEVLCGACGEIINRVKSGDQIVEGPHTITYTDTSVIN